ncbi:MAG: bifunctional glutamate N-acetyltransferase/amino-acid acetyltransferase ArgJ [Candidatus Omnitrophota bacterium]
MKTISGGITRPQGYQANGLWCGIKRSGKPDLALIYSIVPAVAAGVFTKNSVIAAPLVVTKSHLRNHRAQAIIVNSGNANCFTGHFGQVYAKKTTRVVGKLLGIRDTDVLVSSTGIIGKPLPYKKIEGALPLLIKGLNQANGAKAAAAILTTDKAKKEIAVRIKLGGKTVTIGACAKGSGMIAPNMATMLAFITTDAAINVPLLKSALKDAVELSFNSITIDNCMSTNDMVTIMANGRAGNRSIEKEGKDYHIFCDALKYVCLDLAKKIVLDGEGATKFIAVQVSNAATPAQAKKACLAIANSNLVKTAAYGSDPNWGRVAAAVGALGWAVKEEDMKIHFSSFAKKHINIYVDLNLGKCRATVYTCDLSLDYVRINGKYN